MFDPANAIRPYHVLPNFSAHAQEMRDCIDAFFGTPDKDSAKHQVWNYWYVPDSYTYMRSAPDKVIKRALVEAFVQQMVDFCIYNYGLGHVTWPWLSMYVEGCGQVIHNDSRNGALGYVFSLTNWDTRQFIGGETLVFREQDYWASGRFRESHAGQSFYEKVPSLFNQLLLFDDRLIHSVPMVRGVSDQRESRLVLHGHVSLSGIHVQGAMSAGLPPGDADALQAILTHTQAAIQSEAGRYHGFATFALTVEASGEVSQVTPLLQRVLSTLGPLAIGQLPVLTQLCEDLKQLKFSAAEGPSRVSVPVVFA